MIRKIIWGLLISVFFIGFVLSVDSSARPWPVVVWADPCVRILPGSEAPASNSIGQNNSQTPANGEEDSTVAIEESRLLRLEINRIIGGWSNLLHSKLKGIIKR